MKGSKRVDKSAYTNLSRRELLGATAGAGALLALSPRTLSSEVPDRGTRPQTFFFNMSHENYAGQEYFLYIAGRTHRIQEITRASAAALQKLRSNTFLSALPSEQITHVLEETMLPSAQVLLSYMSTNRNYSTGEWDMPCVFLIPPAYGLLSAYEKARAKLGEQVDLPLSAKRAQYGMRPARTYADLVEERMLLDSNDWAAALVNLHPEILSADGNSAAHIQTNYINVYHEQLRRLSYELNQRGAAKPQTGTSDNGGGWATLVPYRDDNGNPIVSHKGNNNKLIQYDTRWQPTLQPFINPIMSNTISLVKDDVSLGVNVAAPDGTAVSRRGAVWTRTDGSATVDQTSAPARAGSDTNFTLTNVTPDFGGYSCQVTNTGSSVSLHATNWYLRYLGFYIQFLKEDKGKTTVVPTSELPAGIVPDDAYVTQNNEIFLSQISPEFVLYGIPLLSSSTSCTFEFPSGVATSAKIIASGLGTGSHTNQDTETLGIVLTSIFNLILPAALLAVGAGTFVDALTKTIGIPFGTTLALYFESSIVDSSPAAIGALFWKAFASGGAKGIATIIGKIGDFLLAAAAGEAAEDAIPIAGLIIQAIGMIGTLLEVATTTSETLSSPWSYVYTLVGTYDLTLTILPDPNGGGTFPSAAINYTTTAIFNNGTPHTITSPVAGNQGGTLQCTFSAVPVGGTVVLSVGFYASDGTLVGKATTSTRTNAPGSNPTVTLTALQYPIKATTVYQHKQLTQLINGQHEWVCAPAPPVPSATSDCSDQPGGICIYRGITVNTATGDVGYGWRSFTPNGCNGGAGLLDQMASVRVASAGTTVQSNYAALPCALSGSAQLVYDPLGRSDINFYVDGSGTQSLLRSVSLDHPAFQDPHSGMAWGAFTLPSDDLLLHPGGVAISINQAASRLETLHLPTEPLPDMQAGKSLIATLHGGSGSRPGLFNGPTAATITSSGVVLVLEQGNSRIHAVNATGNPVRYFTSQHEPYFLVLTETGSEAQYLDIASEYSGLIYVLSYSAGVYRLDVYDPAQSGTTPISTTRNFNAAKIAVDYWRNVYSLNCSLIRGSGVPAGITEPQISQWIPFNVPSCTSDRPPQTRASRAGNRLLRRRDLLAFGPIQA